jgi:DNA-binding XRE family transcriptional regulator
MREMRLSNHEAALVFGADHSTISRWNTGKSKPSIDMGELVCNVLYQETGKLYHPFNLWEGRLTDKKTVYAARMSIAEARAKTHQRAHGWQGDLVTADGLDAAIIGTTSDGRRMIYSLELAVNVLVKRDGMDQDEAREYLMFNSVGAYVGTGSPVWVDTL